MSTSKEQAAGGGITVLGLMWVVLVTLKLLDKLDWSWLVILTFPIWSFITLTVVIIVFALLFLGVVRWSSKN